MSKNNWNVSCDECFLDEDFPMEKHANKMMVYHNATFDCSGAANKQEIVNGN